MEEEEDVTIDKYSSLKEEENDINKTRWVIDRGLRLGKKVVMTGFVVSSAPLVLPPLITISILGFVVLVPAGFFIASYACTELLMSKLLPIPAPPLLLEYNDEHLFGVGNEIEELEGELGGRDCEGDFTVEVGETEEMANATGEERIELAMDTVVEGNGEKLQCVGKHEGKKEVNIDENLKEGYDEDIVEYMEGECEDGEDVNADENLEEKGYEDNAGEYMEGEHENNEEIKIDDNLKVDVVEYLDGECGNENLEKVHEGQREDKKEIKIDENLEEAAVDLEGKCEDEEDTNVVENLEEGYEEDDGEYMEGEQENNEGIKIDDNLKDVIEYEGECGNVNLEKVHEDKKEIKINENLVEEGNEEDIVDLEGKRDDEEDTNVVENLEEGYEEYGGEYMEGEQENDKGIDIDEDLKEDAVEYLNEEHEDENLEKGEYMEGEHVNMEKYVNIDENLEEGYEEDAGEYIEGEHEIKEEINIGENLNEGIVNIDENLEKGYEGEHEDRKEINIIDENLEEDYEDDVIENLEGKCECEKDINIVENLEKGYEEDAGEYMEGEPEDKEQISIIDENLNDTSKYLEGEDKNKEQNNNDKNLEEDYKEVIGEYFEGEREGPMAEMNMEIDHCEFDENVKMTEGLDLVARSVEDENYIEDQVGNKEAAEDFEYKSIALTGSVVSSVKEDEGKHLEKSNGFEEEDIKNDSRSEKGAENPFDSTDTKVARIVAEIKATEAIPIEPKTEEKTIIAEKGNAVEQVSLGLHPSEHNEINTNEGSSVPPNEVMLSEEKIWEQIYAIRAILGYTAAPRSSTVYELKALYVLTGVEPPLSLEDPSNLIDVNEKLRILMSIVGTK